MKRICILCFMHVFFRISVLGQSIEAGEPLVGQPCPDFTFDKVDFYKNKKASISDFRGRWLVLDFWAKDCTACIESFSKISAKQREFGDTVQFFMITYEDKEGQHRPIYKRYHVGLNLLMPCAFQGTSETGIFKQFNVGGLPHIIVIDPEGIVRAITISINSQELRELMAGKTLNFYASYADKKNKVDNFSYDYHHPYLSYGNGGIDSNYIYRSLLSGWTPKNPIFINNRLDAPASEYKWNNNRGRFEALQADLNILYRAAYTGIPQAVNFKDDSTLYTEYWPDPIVEASDKSKFVANYNTGKNVYCYSLIVPPDKGTKEYMMEIMRSDLKHYFGYNVVIESRNMPFWSVIITDPEKVNRMKTKGGPEFFKNDVNKGIAVKNYPIEWFMEMIKNWSGVSVHGIPFYNETGIDYNIDLFFSWYMGDFNSVKKSLQSIGLDLVKKERTMKCIIIHDPE